MVFQCINIRQVLWEELKIAAFGLGFQHIPWDLANVNAWKTMFDPYIVFLFSQEMKLTISCESPEVFRSYLTHESHGDKVSFCDHILSVVCRACACPCIRNNFFRHLLLNHCLDFDQTSQEWSLVGPLSKLFKWFRSVAHLGHNS